MSKSLIQSLVASLFCAGLAACGGGGGSSSAPVGAAASDAGTAGEVAVSDASSGGDLAKAEQEAAFNKYDATAAAMGNADLEASLLTTDLSTLTEGATPSDIAALNDKPFDPNENPIPNDPNDTTSRSTKVSLASAVGDVMKTSALSGAACEGLPPKPSVPAGSVDVRSYGAVPNDDKDDAPAIQKALDSLKPGQWLVFPAGRYIQSKSLWMHVPNTVMWSNGATLHATNKTDQAILLAADGASVYNFSLTAITDVRRSTPWQSRIAIFDDVRNTEPTRNNVIRGNKILAGAPGTPQANGASAAGIYVYFAYNFLIAENEIYRSLSDGMHITQASSNGRVLNNKIRETGDDMIGMVSIFGDNWTKTSGKVESDSFDERARKNIVHDIVVAGNDLQGQYWGRGVSVVGGRGITIRDNVISKPTQAAAIYLAREPGYMTFGVHNVVVKGNKIYDVQTTQPVYNPTGRNLGKSNQAGIEMYAHVFDDESTFANLRSELRVERVHVENNYVETTKQNGLRLGVGSGVRAKISGNDSNGAYRERWYTGVNVGPVNLLTNKFVNVGSAPAMRLMNILNGNPSTFCSSNLMSGLVTGSSLCNTSSTTAVTGAKLTCG